MSKVSKITNLLGESILATVLSSNALRALENDDPIAAKNALHPEASSLSGAINDINNILGLTSGTPSTYGRASAVRAKILETPGFSISYDLGRLARQLVNYSSGVLERDVNRLNSTLDGAIALSGTTRFVLTTNARNDAGIVSIVGGDGLDDQSYSIDTTASGINIGSSPIDSGAKFTLTNSDTGNSITFVNQSVQINTADDLVRYVNTHYPLQSVFTPQSNMKLSELNALLGGNVMYVSAYGRALNLAAQLGRDASMTPNTDLHSMVTDDSDGTTSGLLAKFSPARPASVLAGLNNLAAQIDGSDAASLTGAWGSSGNLTDKLAALAIGGTSTSVAGKVEDINAALDGVSNLSGTSFKVSIAATTDSSSVVTIVGNDGTDGQTYSIAYSAPIPAGAKFILTNSANGNSITFVNNSEMDITSADALQSYLASTYPVNATVSADARSKIAQLGGNVIGQVGLPSDSLSRRLGIPAIKGNPVTFGDVLGGVVPGGVTIASLIGDPVKGDSGLAAQIQAASATDPNDVWTTDAFSSFTSAENLSDQLWKLFGLFQTSALRSGNKIVVTLTDTPPASVADILRMMSLATNNEG